MPPEESLEKAQQAIKDSENINKKEQERLELEQNFYNLPEIENLIPNLKEFIPSKSEQILNRLLLKYEKDPNIFKLNNSLRKVIFGENTGAYPISGILLEHHDNDKTNYIKEEREQLYKKLINETFKNQENTEINYNKPKETKEAANNLEKVDKNLFHTPLTPVIDGLIKNGYSIENGGDKSEKEQKSIIKKNINGNKELEINLSNYLEQINTVTESTFEKSSFYQDAEQFSFLGEEVNGMDLLLAENYIKIPNKENGKINIEEDINRTMDIALNKILKVNSKEFNDVNAELINNIRLEINILEKYNLMQEIHKLDLKSDAKFFSKNNKLRKIKIEKKLENIEKNIKIEKNIEKIEKLIQEKKNLEIQLEGIKKISKKETKGDIGSLSGGENEAPTNNLETK